LALNRFCLDTSAYCNFLRGDPQVIALIDSAVWLGVPAIVLGELRTGFMLGARREENERILAAFLRNPVVEVVVVEEETAEIYADIVVALRSAGTPLPTNDIWIAAVAARVGAPVLTYDAHFGQIHRVSSRILPEKRSDGTSPSAA
jgi:tRNA(fMet)-specific endonuclease VapC